MRELIISEFFGTPEKIFETEGIRNISELQKYCNLRGYSYYDKTATEYIKNEKDEITPVKKRYIILQKGTVKISVPIALNMFENELSMSIVMASIRKKLTTAKH